MAEEKTGSSIPKRILAVVILAVALWILLKFVIHLLLAVSTGVVIIVAIIAAIWAIRTL